MFKSVKELYIAGGGAAGRSLPAALEEAVNHGLDLEKVEAVCATSVGSILALTLVLKVPIKDLAELLDKMPTHTFQDWSFPHSLFNFFRTWGWCKGEAMPAYFRKFIKERTQLEDPTFQELYDAGFTQELRVVTANADKKNMTLFSYKLTPNQKVADIIALSCSVFLLFPPKAIISEDGKSELHTDGGAVKNYPFGVGCKPSLSSKEKLGFNFVNKVHLGASPIRSFIQYIKSILKMIFFGHSAILDDSVKKRTVSIEVDHNPLRFCATKKEQAALNKAGKMAVKDLVKRMSESLENREQRNNVFEFQNNSKAVSFRSHKRRRTGSHPDDFYVTSDIGNIGRMKR